MKTVYLSKEFAITYGGISLEMSDIVLQVTDEILPDPHFSSSEKVFVNEENGMFGFYVDTALVKPGATFPYKVEIEEKPEYLDIVKFCERFYPEVLPKE